MRVLWADALHALASIPDDSIPLIYTDPPFNTGRTQRLQRTVDYGIPVAPERSYQDDRDDYIDWLAEHMREAKRVLTANGTIYLHLDYHEVHYAKVMMDAVFGRSNFLNEIIWCYDYGGRTKRRWPPKHDNILVYVKDVRNYVFNYDAIDRIPYMAPGLQTAERAAEGKTPTDAWWMTIVPTNGPERTGYPTQKPRKLVERIIAASSNPGDVVLDFFAGSGTTGAAAHNLGRDALLVDTNGEAISVIRRRLANVEGVEYDDGSVPSEGEERGEDTAKKFGSSPVYAADSTEQP